MRTFCHIAAIVGLLLIQPGITGSAEAVNVGGCYINSLGDAICDSEWRQRRPREMPRPRPRPDDPCRADPQKCKPIVKKPNICDLFPDLCKSVPCTAISKPIIDPPPGGCEAEVTPATFKRELDNKGCGCKLLLAPGNYPDFTYTKKCTASNTFMIQAKADGVRFKDFTVNGNGLFFSGPEVSNQITIDGDYNRITQVLFTKSGQIDFKEGSASNRIDHNDFILDPRGTGETATAIAFYRPRSTEQMYQNNQIDSNYFTTNTPVPTSRQPGNGIFLCMYGAQNGYQYLSRFGSAKTLIENNLFEDWGRKHVMEVKCSDNVFRNNTLVNTGRILNRHGGNNIYENNYFQNMTTGLAVREYDNRVTGNYFERARIILYSGTRKYPDGQCFQDRAWMPAPYRAPQGPPAVRTYINNNKGPLSIGESEGNGCEVPVLNTTIGCHDGPVQYKGAHVGTQGPSKTGACGPIPRKLTRADVGRGTFGDPGGSQPIICPLPLELAKPRPEERVQPRPASCMPKRACSDRPVDASGLQQGLNSASCGCTIKLAGGAYPGNYTFSKNCPRDNPVGIEAADHLKPNLSGQLTLRGSGAIVTGLSVTGRGTVYINGDYHRVSRNRFAATGRAVIEVRGAEHAEISYNDFVDSGSNNLIIIGAHVGTTEDEVKYTHIHHNYVQGSGRSGGGDAITAGLYGARSERDKMLAHGQTYSLIEYNIFDNVRRSKSVHLKTLHDTVQYNYVHGSASMDSRQGQYNTFKGNYFDGGGGNVGVHEEFNQLLCNRMETGSILVFAGEGGLTKFGTYQSGTAKDTLVSGNNGRLVLGEIWGLHGRTTPDEPALRTEVRGHAGRIDEKFHRDSRTNAGASPVCTAPAAPPVQRSQVGIDAPDEACRPTGGGVPGGGDDGGEPVDCASGEPVEMTCPAFKDDLFLNPFNARSAHHRPIGCGARYAGEGDATTVAIKAHAGRGTINAALPFGAAFAKLKASDPIKTVTKTGLCGGPGPGIGLPVTIKIPPDWPPGWQSKFRCLDNSTKLYDPETGVATEFFAFDPSDPGNYRATIARTFDIRGLGHGTALNQRLGTSASGASTLMGALRAEEVLTPGTPMLHAHHVAVPRLPGHNTPLLLGRGIQWPATAGDGSAYRDATHNTGVFAYGDLLGIPPESKGGPNLDTLGLSEPGRRLAQSFRDYGVYVVDGGPQVVMRATDSLGSLHATMRDDFRKLWPHLRLITNSVAGATAKISASSHSASGSIGIPAWPAGGGTPLAPNCAFDAR